jgi:hypothetical protein
VPTRAKQGLQQHILGDPMGNMPHQVALCLNSMKTLNLCHLRLLDIVPVQRVVMQRKK